MGIEAGFIDQCDEQGETAAAHPRAASCGALRFKINLQGTGHMAHSYL
jgi:hypothetical protein